LDLHVINKATKTRQRKKHTDNNGNNNVSLQNCLISPTTFIKEVPNFPATTAASIVLVGRSSKQNIVSIPHKPAGIDCFKFKCAKCNMMFNQIAHLREHIKTHERPFECGRCGEKFAKVSLLQLHVEMHH